MIMKKVVLALVLTVVANASSLSGVYHNARGATIEITEMKDDDIQLSIQKGYCNFQMNESKFNIHKNKLVSTDDQGYGPMRMVTFIFTKNGFSADFTLKLVTDFGCSEDIIPFLNGKYTKK